MTTGLYAPDGSYRVTLTGGNGTTTGSEVEIVTSAGDALDYSEPLLVQDYVAAANDLSSVVINTASSGDITAVAATASQTTRVHRICLTSAGTTSVTIKRGSTTIGKFEMIAGSAIVLPFQSRPWFATAVNETFVVSNGSAVQLSGLVEFITSV